VQKLFPGAFVHRRLSLSFIFDEPETRNAVRDDRLPVLTREIISFDRLYSWRDAATTDLLSNMTLS